MDKIKSFSDLVLQYGVTELAFDMFGEDIDRKYYHRVYKWYVKNSINSKYWPRLIIKCRKKGLKINLKQLMEMNNV